MIDTVEIDQTEIEKPRKRAPKTYEVHLKKSAWIDGECIGNQDAIIHVEQDVYNRLKAARVI